MIRCCVPACQEQPAVLEDDRSHSAETASRHRGGERPSLRPRVEQLYVIQKRDSAPDRVPDTRDPGDPSVVEHEHAVGAA